MLTRKRETTRVHIDKKVWHLNCDTLARNRALAARGYVVVSVPWWEWNELKKDDQAAYLTRKIEGGLKQQQQGSGGGGRGAGGRRGKAKGAGGGGGVAAAA